MKCINSLCNADLIEEDDNFCYQCGHPTALGYAYLNKQENIKEILNGAVIKQDNKFKIFATSFLILTITFILVGIIRGYSLFKPVFYLKRQLDSYIYGYNTSIIKTDNRYNKINVNNLEESKMLIKKDFDNQIWKCKYDLDILKKPRRIRKKLFNY